MLQPTSRSCYLHTFASITALGNSDCCPTPTSQLLLLPCCPESPVWLEPRDKEAADEACLALWGEHAVLFEAPPDLEVEAGLALLSGAAFPGSVGSAPGAAEAWGSGYMQEVSLRPVAWGVGAGLRRAWGGRMSG